MQACVVVLGPYRSGTSLTSQMLRALGVDFGPESALISTNRFNPGGYLERGDVNAWNRRLLISAGRTLGEPGEPASLIEQADASILDDAEFPWSPCGPTWGLKDPRFCATLAIWVESGAIPIESLRIVLVDRQPDAIIRSSLEHPSVRRFCDGDEERALAMIESYRRLAAWQVEWLNVPTHRVSYENLMSDPHEESRRLAGWLGMSDGRAISRAANLVGKRSARARYLVHTSCTLPVRAARKAMRMIRSQA